MLFQKCLFHLQWQSSELPVTGIEEEEGDDNDENMDNGDDDDSDDDDDDDLGDVKDTREYMPIDVEGLESMGLANSSGPMYFAEDEDDEDSDVEDTNLSPDDALIVVAKTEEVRS